VGPDRFPIFLDVPVELFTANALLLKDKIRAEGFVKTEASQHRLSVKTLQKLTSDEHRKLFVAQYVEEPDDLSVV
jgi:hypothetical protein